MSVNLFFIVLLLQYFDEIRGCVIDDSNFYDHVADWVTNNQSLHACGPVEDWGTNFSLFLTFIHT